MAKRGNPVVGRPISIAGECPSNRTHTLPGGPKFSLFGEGNLYSCKENMSPEANARRLRGLAKCWTMKARKKRGERIISSKAKRRTALRHRIRLRENMIKEAREIQEMAKGFTADAMKRVHQIIEDQHAKDSDIIAAAQFLHDRAYGKATQTSISAQVDTNGKPTDIGAKELDARIKQALERVERITGGTAEEGKGEERPADVRISDRDPGGSSVH
jgi:TolA-binding protein